MIALLLLCSLPGQTTESKDFSKEIQRAALAASVRILAAEDKGGSKGTGVVLKKKGDFLYVLTAAHVIGKAERVEIHAFTAKSHPDPAAICRAAEILARMPDQDLAVLRCPVGKFASAPVILARPKRGPLDARFPALSVGCSRGEAPTCAVEAVLGKKLLQIGKEVQVFAWELEQAPSEGRSGGPLLDAKGQLLGICRGKQDGRGYYTHADEIRVALKRQGLAWLADAKEEGDKGR